MALRNIPGPRRRRRRRPAPYVRRRDRVGGVLGGVGGALARAQ